GGEAMTRRALSLCTTALLAVSLGGCDWLTGSSSSPSSSPPLTSAPMPSSDAAPASDPAPAQDGGAEQPASEPIPSTPPAAPPSGPQSAPGSDFTYFQPSDEVPGSGSSYVATSAPIAPNICFPIRAKAFANSQVWGVGGIKGAKGSQCDAANYSYPW